MKWHVTAADAQTGEDRVFLIDAATPADAEAAVRQAGYLVSQVIVASQAEGSPSADDRADPLAALAAAATAPAVSRVAPPAAPLGYRLPPDARGADLAVSAPEYWGLRFGSMAFLVFAFVFYLAGVLGLLAGLGMLVNSLGYTSGWGVVAAFGQFLLSVWPLAIGTVFHAASSACFALRDIARNSFAD